MKSLTSEFLIDLPHFNDRLEAFQWFKEKFNDNFILKGDGTIEGEKIYFYHLIMDKGPYIRGMKELEEKGLTAGIELAVSYHIVVILEYGRTQLLF